MDFYKNYIKFSTKNNGLPCKSFIYIIELDVLLKQGLSIISNLKDFDNYVACNLSWKFRKKDRQDMVENFINFMMINDIDRINFLFNKNMFGRKNCIKVISHVYNNIKNNFVVPFYVKQHIPSIHKKINDLLETITKHYLYLVIKHIMYNRRGEDPDNVKIDGYNTLLEMIANYDYNRSKVPFSTLLKFYSKSAKSKVVKRQTLTHDLLEEKEINPNFSFDNIEVSDIIRDIFDIPELFRIILFLSHSYIVPLNRYEEMQLLIQRRKYE